MIVLYGAGTTGRVIVRDLTAKGIPCILTDSDQRKWGQIMEGVMVISPEDAKAEYPDATWVASVIRPERAEVIANILDLGVKLDDVWNYLPKRHNLPPNGVFVSLLNMLGDEESALVLKDQLSFRRQPHRTQMPPSDINEIYWPEFIVRRDDEHYVDCGAADGDTVKEFRKRWANYSQIRAFEPDAKNYRKLAVSCLDDERNHAVNAAVSDRNGQMVFTSTGDYSAHLGGDGAVDYVNVYQLDDVLVAPTYIKMDIEGSEPAALWGARRILRDHKPVLAICAYHQAEHLWEIPLLIHALQPEYKLFFRRYAEGAFELVWYAVPPERVK